MTTASRTDTGVTADISVTATFAINTYTLTYTAGAHGSITGTTPQTVDYGSDGTTVTAVPDTGYHFVAWSDGVTTASRTDTGVTTDISVTATFAINTYTVTFYDYDGTTVLGTDTVNHGSGATAPADPDNQPGYHFTGWDKDFSNVTSNLDVTAQYAINTYTVTFYDYDGTTVLGTQTVNHGSGATAPANPDNQPGYHFTGWDKSFSNVTSDLTVTAQYAINTYTVTFKDYNGTTLGTQTVNHGSGATAPANPNNQPGYHFTGWDTDFSSVTSNLDVTAEYAINTYTVTFYDYDGTTVLGTQTVNHGSGATAPANPDNQPGYHFTGWDKSFSNVTSDLTVTAQYAINTYTVTFKDYNGTTLGTQTVNHGSGATAPANPNNQPGYHFTGWDKSFSNVTGNLDVTAVYAINTYTVRFFGADGVTQIGTSQTVNWGGAAVVETAPARAGLTFTGWVVTGDDPTVATNLNNVRENINAVASYNATIYTVRFEDFDGTLLGTDRVPSGGDAIPPANPEREGYDFTGWSPSYDNVTGNITVVAEYEIKTFTVTFVDFDGTVIDEQTIDWNTGATAPEAPAREGFEFTGWDKEFDPVTSDLTVTAQYAAIEAPTPTPEPTEIPPEAPPTTGGGGTWLWWLLLIPALGILIWLILAWLTIVPIAEAVTKNADGTMTIRWGYENRKLRKQKVEPEDSELTALAGQIINSSAVPPVEFEKGRVENVFTTTAAANAVVQWKIRNRKAKVDLSKGEKK